MDEFQKHVFSIFDSYSVYITGRKRVIMAVIKGQGLGISLAYHEHEPWLLSCVGHRRQVEPNEAPSC